MGLAEAMTEARKRGLDLVEVNPAANPPVCKILDYGKYLYNLAKKEKDTKKNRPRRPSSRNSIST